MKDMKFEGEEFNDFIHELIKTKRFNDTKEEGIAKLVIDQGFQSLSDKQKYVFRDAINDLVYDECQRCGNEIPWCEMSAAEDNGQLCSYCYQVGSMDD